MSLREALERLLAAADHCHKIGRVSAVLCAEAENARAVLEASPVPNVDIETFIAGLDSPNHSPESRRAWIVMFYRDLKMARDLHR